MDVAALSILMHQSSVKQQAGIAILKKAMNTAESSKEALLKTMEMSVNPNLGASFDAKV